MRLKNKRTGEIGELQITEKHCAVVVGNGTADCNVKLYCTLDKLNEEWEDMPEEEYEEPKEYWFINSVGGVIRPSDTTDWEQQDATHHKEIGNYFETEEEAEEAVEKLKAWKRLKDKGFRFLGYYHTLGETKSKGEIGFEMADYKGIKQDLELLFGGEE